MKTKKLNQKNVQDALVAIGSTVVGYIVAGAFYPLVNDEDQKRLLKAGLLVAGTSGAAMLPTTDALSLAAKSASAGIAVRGARDLVFPEIQKAVATALAKKEASGTALTKVDQALKSAVGLACPSGPGMLRSALPMPKVHVQTLETRDMGGNSYEATVSDGVGAA